MIVSVSQSFSESGETRKRTASGAGKLTIFLYSVDRYEMRIVILWTVYARTDRPSPHGSGWEGDQHFFPSLII
jgi:hypothetical protein